MGVGAVHRGSRAISYEVFGDDGGRPLVYLHGTPGSRLDAVAFVAELTDRGFTTIAIDRPGYGLSDPLPDRAVGDAVVDVEAVADELGIDTFSVLGQSGGGPPAIACAVLLPQRVTRLATLGSPAPYDPDAFDWFADLHPASVSEYRLGLEGREALTAHVMDLTEQARENPRRILDAWMDDLPEPDRVAWSSAESDTSALSEALRVPDGWIDDDLGFVRPWGFDLAPLAMPASIWRGDLDVLSPPHHARYLAERLGAELIVPRGVGHVMSIDPIVDWLARA